MVSVVHDDYRFRQGLLGRRATKRERPWERERWTVAGDGSGVIGIFPNGMDSSVILSRP
jgi:hypothetical protein